MKYTSQQHSMMVDSVAESHNLLKRQIDFNNQFRNVYWRTVSQPDGDILVGSSETLRMVCRTREMDRDSRILIRQAELMYDAYESDPDKFEQMWPRFRDEFSAYGKKWSESAVSVVDTLRKILESGLK